ncbi:nucleolar protein [Coemansia guatemalensis]|uniref:Nucleolar protein n=1 Tax=Coemansia guatemalensis TaxID=2761395 RepID=A0A9W8I1F3_9FUNG|nr:nucleolar protein [Coemansia guatemalensis]
MARGSRATAAKPANNKKKAPVAAAPTPAKKALPKPKDIAEPISDSESEPSGSEEATIYEQMTDDSAVEDDSDSEVEENQEASEEASEEGEEEEMDSEEGEESNEESEDGIDEEALLAGIKGGDSDLSESETEADDEFRKNSSKIELDEEIGNQIRARLDKIKKTKGDKGGVIYVGRIPHGFYEEQMMGYFKQFGSIKRLRLSRNPHTGRSRHYAFIEFSNSEVAKIVAETMDNYLMFDRLLKCKLVPEDKAHPRLFVNRNRKVDVGRNLRRQKAIQERQRTQEDVNKQIDRLVKKEKRRRNKIAAAGIDYSFPGYQELRPPKAKHLKFV